MCETDSLGKMHELLLEALRSREQEVFKYLGILGPALGGFAWLVYVTVWSNGATSAPTSGDRERFFIVGTIGVLLLLLLGAIYSLALGYNFRYIQLELAKLERRLNISAAMLQAWPKHQSEFSEKYWYCLPPEVIKYFWCAFVGGILFVTVGACVLNPDCRVLLWLLPSGFICLSLALLFPLHFGRKLTKATRKEDEA